MKYMQEDVLKVIRSKKKYCVGYTTCTNICTVMMKNLRCSLTCVFNVANKFIAMSEDFFPENDAFLRLILVEVVLFPACFSSTIFILSRCNGLCDEETCNRKRKSKQKMLSD